MILQAGARLHRFTLIRPLGVGGMGEVWLASDGEDNSAPVALKIPTDPDYVRQLRREGALQEALDHPGIVKVFEIHVDPPPAYCAMEYVEGKNLREVIRQRGALPPEMAAGIIRGILSGLGEAHRHGVIHRDLKPENILMGTDGIPRIADFGLGRVQESLSKSLLVMGSLLSSAGNSIAGTYDYMAPEQKKGGEVGPSADIHAVGLVFYELLTGVRPSGGIRRSLARREVDPRLIDLIARMTDMPEHRISSVPEVVVALDEIFGDAEQGLISVPDTTTAAPAPAAKRALTPESREHPGPPAAVQLPAAAEVASASPHAVKTKPPPRPGGRNYTAFVTSGLAACGLLALAWWFTLGVGREPVIRTDEWLQVSGSNSGTGELENGKLNAPADPGSLVVTAVATPEAGLAVYTITTSPPGGVIRFDDGREAFAPVRWHPSSDAPRILRVSLPGYRPWSILVRPSPGDPPRRGIHASLAPE